MICTLFPLSDKHQKSINRNWFLSHNSVMMPIDLNKYNKTLRSIFPEPPVIAYRNNPSLKQKLVQAKLKPIAETTELEDTQPNHNTQIHTTHSPDTEYPYTIFKNSLQKFRNPIK